MQFDMSQRLEESMHFCGRVRKLEDVWERSGINIGGVSQLNDALQCVTRCRLSAPQQSRSIGLSLARHGTLSS
eukprot:5659360-Amphidinium_carterae.2